MTHPAPSEIADLAADVAEIAKLREDRKADEALLRDLRHVAKELGLAWHGDSQTLRVMFEEIQRGRALTADIAAKAEAAVHTAIRDGVINWRGESYSAFVKQLTDIITRIFEGRSE